ELAVPPRASAYFAGRDPALEAILGYAKAPSLVDRMLAAYDHGGMKAALGVFDAERQVIPDDLWHDYPSQLGLFADRLEQRDLKEDPVVGVLQYATRLYPDYWRAWFRLGLASYQRGDWADAVASFDRAAELEPDE